MLSLRAQNKKSQKAANAMVKMTKSANRAVIKDAQNDSETGATKAGRYQPDEDDYGYESSVANSIYEKLMKKFEANYEDPMDKFKRPPSMAKAKPKITNDPKFQPFRKPAENSKKSSPEPSKASKTGSNGIKKSSAPPPSFQELLKMAKAGGSSKKSDKDLVGKNVKEAEFNRPMTAKEKEEFIRERNSQLRKEGKLPRKEVVKKAPEPVKKSDKQEVKNVPSSSGKNTPSSSKNGKIRKVESREFPPRDIRKIESRPFPPPEFSKKRPRSPSPIRAKKSSNARSNRIESDDEDYDSEMDDFIDDSDAKIDVSAEISKLFGYDRRKYRDEDFDDRSMENNRFADIMKEEARSAKIGRMEDLEDMRREEEEKKRKMMKKRRY